MAARFTNLKNLRESVRARVDYASFYQRYCPNGRRRNSRLEVSCPIPSHRHSGNGRPSLSIDLDHGLFHCFSRGEGGDIFRFFELMHSVSFREAVCLIAAEVESDKDFEIRGVHPNSVQTKTLVPADLKTSSLAQIGKHLIDACNREEQSQGISYLMRRGISEEAIRRAGIAYFPLNSYSRVMDGLMERFLLSDLKSSGLFGDGGQLTFYKHRLLFPFFHDGQVAYIQARSISRSGSRWHNLRGSVPCLYNICSLATLASGSLVYLVEGLTDTLTFLTHGFNAVGIVGAGGFKEEWLGQLGRFVVVSALDDDLAGSLASERYRAMFHARGLKLARLKLPRDVNDYFRNSSTAALDLTLLTEAAIEDAQNWEGTLTSQ